MLSFSSNHSTQSILDIYASFFDSDSLKTVFYKTPTGNHLRFLIDIIIKKRRSLFDCKYTAFEILYI